MGEKPKHLKSVVTTIVDFLYHTTPEEYVLLLVVSPKLSQREVGKFVSHLLSHLSTFRNKPKILRAININIGHEPSLNTFDVLTRAAYLIWEVHRVIVVDCAGDTQSIIEMAMRLKRPYQYYSSTSFNSPFHTYKRVDLTKHAY